MSQRGSDPGPQTRRGRLESSAGGQGPTDPEVGGPETEGEGLEGWEGDPAEDEPVRLPIEPVLDLHSFQPREVESVVEEYLEQARLAGFEEIRIIHGRGIGQQREIVRAVLARTSFVVSFRDAPPERGGWGATIAWLRL